MFLRGVNLRATVSLRKCPHTTAGLSAEFDVLSLAIVSGRWDLEVTIWGPEQHFYETRAQVGLFMNVAFCATDAIGSNQGQSL